MKDLSDIEERLRSAAFAWPRTGEHLSDSRLAQMCDGAEPSDAEAAHLAGCDICVPLLIELGKGLESFTVSETENALSDVIRPMRPRTRIGSKVVALGLLAACAYAAVTWVKDSRKEVGTPISEGAQTPALKSNAAVAPAVQAIEDSKPMGKPRGDGMPAAQSNGVVQPRMQPQRNINEGLKTIERVPEKAHQTIQDEKPHVSETGVLRKSLSVAPPKTRQKARTGTPVQPRVRASTSSPRKSGKNAPVRSLKTMAPSKARASQGVGLTRKQTAQSVHDKKSRVQQQTPPGRNALDGRKGPTEFTRVAVNAASRGFGQLRLNSRPAAEVFIDGKSRGWTPLFDLRLQAGPHDIRLVYKSPLAAKVEERFRVMIQADKIWATVRDNRKKSAD